MSHIGTKKFKTFKYDSAPFFFYIDIFPTDPELEKDRSKSLSDKIKTNPINPLPMRVDRVFNGERSVLIRPQEPIIFPLSEKINAIINPIPFLQMGIEKLLFFTEIRAYEQFFESIVPKVGRLKVSRWWDTMRNSYAPLFRLEEDFSAFLRAYLFTVVKAKITSISNQTKIKKITDMFEEPTKIKIATISTVMEMDETELTESLVKNRHEKAKFIIEGEYIQIQDMEGVGEITEILDKMLEGGDVIEAAKMYCQMVHDSCNKRMLENFIRTDMKGKQKDVKMYKKKEITFYKKRKKVHEVQYHPELIDIEIFDLTEREFNEGEERSVIFEELKKSEKIKYIALLFYDDLMECMLQNLERLGDGDTDILDPMDLIEKNIIVLEDRTQPSKFSPKELTWWRNFDEIDLDAPIEKIEAVNAKSMELLGKLDSITDLMDKQQFEEALGKFKQFLDVIMEEGHQHFSFSIENLMKACEINIELRSENEKYRKLFEDGKIQESYDGLNQLIEKMKDKEFKEYVDGHVDVEITRTFRMVIGKMSLTR